MNNSEGQGQEHQSDDNERRDLRVFRYRSYRLRQGLKTFFVSLGWDFRSRLQKADFLVEVVGIVVLIIYTFYTAEMYTANRDSANAAQTAAIAARSAAETASKQLEMAERPWISADIAAITPLVFTADGGRMTVKISLRNQGHSPAVRGLVEPILMPAFLLHPDPAEVRTKLCKKLTEQANMRPTEDYLLSSMWPPGEQPPSLYNILASRADIDKAQYVTPRLWIKDTKGVKTIELYLITCIAYRPTFTNATYQTSYVIDLDTKNNPGLISPALGSSIPLNELRMTYDFRGGIRGN